MKKIISTLALAALSTGAFANILMPEISRDGKTKNDSLMAVSQSSRNFVAAELSSLTLEDSASNELDVVGKSVYGGFTNGAFNMELAYNNANYEIGSNDTDFTNLNLLAGFRVNKNLTLGLGLESNELISGIDETILAIGGTLLVNGTVLGGEISKHTYEVGTAEGDFILLTGAFGAAQKDLTWETGITYQLEGSGDLLTGSRLGVFGNITKISGAWEFDTSLNYTYGDYLKNATADNDYSSIDFDFYAEYMLNSQVYITPGVSYASLDQPGTANDTDMFTLSGTVGFRNGQGLDASFGLEYVVSGEMGGDDVDGLGWAANVGYAF